MSLSTGYASIARMLDYPGNREELLADHEIVRGVLSERGMESPLTPFARFVESSTLARLQEEYVATFDFNPAAALYLGHHLFGDNRKKGEYLIRLKREFERHGFSPSGHELPDHLPRLLGFLAHLARHADDRTRREFISAHVLPGAERLGAGFAARKDSPWKPVVETATLLCAAGAALHEEGKPC